MISRIITRTLLCGFISICIGYMVPALFAYLDNAFFEKEIIEKIQCLSKKTCNINESTVLRGNDNNHCETHDKSKDELTVLCKNDDKHYETYKKSYDFLYKRQHDEEEPSNTYSLSSNKKTSSFSVKMDTEKDKYVVLPIYKSSAYFVWPALFTSLWWLIFIFPEFTRCLWDENEISHYNHKLKIDAQAVIWSVMIFTAYLVPFLFRNEFTGNLDRIIFAYTNKDICKICYYTLWFHGAIFSISLSAIWKAWSAYFSECKNTIYSISIHDEKLTIETIATSVITIKRYVSICFAQWQIASIMLGLGFIFYSSYFWILISKYGDSRYIIDGVIIHSLWAITWVVISLPIMYIWIAWHRETIKLRKTLLLKDKEYIKNDAGKNCENDIGISDIMTTSPIGIWNLIVSSIAAVVSFFAPLFQS